MTRLASLLMLVLVLVASPAWACQYGSAGSPVVGLVPVNVQYLAVAASSVGFTLPTTYGDGSSYTGVILEAVVYVADGAVNVLDNGGTPTASTTAGGFPYGSSAAGGATLNVCGRGAISNFRMISQSGTSNLVIGYYGTPR